MKFTIAWCVLGFQENTTTTAAMLTCGTACQSLNSSLTDNLLAGNMKLQYQYCSVNSGEFSQNVGSCIQCISKIPAAKTLVNCKTQNARTPHWESSRNGLTFDDQTWRY